MFEYNSKQISVQKEPIKLDDKNMFEVTYESIDPIRHVSAFYDHAASSA